MGEKYLRVKRVKPKGSRINHINGLTKYLAECIEYDALPGLSEWYDLIDLQPNPSTALQAAKVAVELLLAYERGEQTGYQQGWDNATPEK